MIIRHRPDLTDHHVTPEAIYLSRRKVLGMGAGLVISNFLPDKVPQPDKPTAFNDATSYNNFYEFGTDKADPAQLAPEHFTNLRPWMVSVDGLCDKPATLELDDLFRPHSLQEHIYRMRCVEGWSMVIPWIGVPLGQILARFAPKSTAKFVGFTTLVDAKRMPAQRTRLLAWPYREGLRLDEAMHPLTLLAVGAYGRDLLPQNGAPVRLVVPWKYGFKSIKSIVRITFTDQIPDTTWNMMSSREYGFYSNVNPAVDHPRWSQASERRIGEFLRRPTLPFNGYGDQVASLYQGMDLKVNF